ncbi:zinc finger protein [Crotalus adamanteus]|uniref:Zinc finger protein n=1 Tax=Crotalus adamanteus TaxID=8729 RepID=A0AAW1BT77_CROAD
MGQYGHQLLVNEQVVRRQLSLSIRREPFTPVPCLGTILLRTDRFLYMHDWSSEQEDRKCIAGAEKTFHVKTSCLNLVNECSEFRTNHQRTKTMNQLPLGNQASLSGRTKTGSVLPVQDSISFKEVVIYFTKEEWALLDPDQKALHEEIMLETCRNVAFLSNERKNKQEAETEPLRVIKVEVGEETFQNQCPSKNQEEIQEEALSAFNTSQRRAEKRVQHPRGNVQSPRQTAAASRSGTRRRN